MAIITLTVKELNAPIKTHKVRKWVKEIRPIPLQPTETYSRLKNTEIERAVKR